MALEKTILAVCAKCEKAVLPHRICAYCGFYDGKEVIDVLAKLTKKEKKHREKEEAAAAAAAPSQKLDPAELSRK